MKTIVKRAISGTISTHSTPMDKEIMQHAAVDKIT
jgi:hypothetical protein